MYSCLHNKYYLLLISLLSPIECNMVTIPRWSHIQALTKTRPVYLLQDFCMHGQSMQTNNSSLSFAAWNQQGGNQKNKQRSLSSDSSGIDSFLPSSLTLCIWLSQLSQPASFSCYKQNVQRLTECGIFAAHAYCSVKQNHSQPQYRTMQYASGMT